MTKIMLRICFTFFAMMFLVTASAEAGPNLQADTNALVYDGWPPFSYSDPQGDYNLPPQTRVDISSVAPVPANSNGSASARAWAEYGKLGVYATSAGGVWVDLYSAYYDAPMATSSASFTDSWTISFPGLENQSAVVYPTVSLWGSIIKGSINGSTPSASAQINLFGAGNGEAYVYDISDMGIAPITKTLDPIHFVFGVPFEITLQLACSTYINGTVDLDSTALLSGINIFSGGVEVSGYSLIAGSGQNYPVSNETTVPEPTTMLLLGLGLMGLAGVRRKIQK